MRSETTPEAQPRIDQPALASLARHEMLSYAKHPLFLVGAVLTVVTLFFSPDGDDSSLFAVLVPAALLGVFGIIVMTSLVRRSNQAHEAAGTVVADERTRTLALASSAVVPFTVGLVWFGWAVWAYHQWPPAPNTMPFGEVGDGWAYALMFALGPMAALGGPILGLVIGRWAAFRGAGPVFAVLIILGTIVMQGIVEPLRFVRVVWPWTYFGGPLGTDSDPERYVIMTGSPFWYVAYLAALCVLGVLVAMLHDRERPRSGLARTTAGVAVLAVVLCVLAMTMGVQSEIVNPLPGPDL